MSWLNRLKILFCMQIFFRSSGAIVSNEVNSTSMTLDEWKSFMETAYASIRYCEVVEFVLSERSMIPGNITVNISFNTSVPLSGATLNVIEDDDLISRTRTSLWAASSSPQAYQNVVYTPTPQIFDYTGDFTFMQNFEEGSALTRFVDSNGNENIVGVLKHNYIVKTLLRQKSYLSICANNLIPQEYAERHTNGENDALSDPNLHRLKRQITTSNKVPEVVHPKLLIIPDFSIVKRFKNERDLIIQIIAHLNYVDMMFRQLKDPEVHLNIAGIIIPSDNQTTPYISNHIGADNRIHGDIVVNEAEIYFQNETNRFPRGKWDSILMLTTYPITSSEVNTNELVTVEGFNQSSRGCSGSAAITRLSERLESIYDIAHEISNMFSEKRGDENVQAGQCENVYGHGMFIGLNYFAENVWSNCSRTALQTYFRSDAGNCTYSQAPRVPDAIKSMPGTWLTFAGRCDNLSNDFTTICNWEVVPGCFLYGCGAKGQCVFTTNHPLNGSLTFYDYSVQNCVNETTVVS